MSKTFKEWRNGKPPSWIMGETLARYVDSWNSPEFTIRSTRNQENRNTPIGTLGNVKHTSGSIPIAEHRERLCLFAAEMRKKDRSVCLLFAFEDKQRSSEEQTSILPPLHVAKFRWWCCQNCL